MPDQRLDVLCIGNAIVDVIADATDDFLSEEGLVKGSMRLIDAEEAGRLYGHMGPAHQVSGGSAGNTAAGVAALGGREVQGLQFVLEVLDGCFFEGPRV